MCPPLDLALAMRGRAATYLSRLQNGHRDNPSRMFLSRYVLAYSVLGRPLNDGQLARLSSAVLAAPAAAA